MDALHGSLTGRLTVTTPTATLDSTTDTVIRSERYRIRFDSPRQAQACAGLAGATRFMWDALLADQEARYRLWQANPLGPKPVSTFFTLGKRALALRNGTCLHGVQGDTDTGFLQDCPAACLRYTAKYLADAYTRYFQAKKEAEDRGEKLPIRRADGQPVTFPRRKSKHRTVAGFTIPQAVHMDGTRLHIPKMGWVRLSGGHQYLGCQARQVRVLKEGTDERPKWYAHVCYTVPVDRVKPPAATDALGLDRNVGQATDSDGRVYTVPDTSQLDANIRRKQRQADKARERSRRNGQPLSNRGRRICGQLTRLHRKQKRTREATAHRHSRTLADTVHTVVIEDLHTKDMTRSAKGTAEEPGRNVKQKSGLNREILQSNWGRMEQYLSYKAGELLQVDPAYTSQTCAVCQHVDTENRKTQSLFQCTACGHTANAAINILVRGCPWTRPARGVGASARREAFPLGTSTTREPGRQGIPPPARAGPSGPAPVPSVNHSV